MKISNIIAVLVSTLAIGNAVAEPTTSNLTDNQQQPAAAAATNTTSTASENKHLLSDTKITTMVKEKFVSEKLFDKKDISFFGVHVKTVNGVVYLKGKVGNQKQADNAVNIAKSVEGVKEVKSKIEVKTQKVKMDKNTSTPKQ